MDALRVVAEHQQERAREAVEHVDANLTPDMIPIDRRSVPESVRNENLSKLNNLNHLLEDAVTQTKTAAHLTHAMSLRDVGFSEVAQNTHKRANSLWKQVILAELFKSVEKRGPNRENPTEGSRSASRMSFDILLNNPDVRELNRTPSLHSTYATVLAEAREFRRGLD